VASIQRETRNRRQRSCDQRSCRPVPRSATSPRLPPRVPQQQKCPGRNGDDQKFTVGTCEQLGYARNHDMPSLEPCTRTGAMPDSEKHQTCDRGVATRLVPKPSSRTGRGQHWPGNPIARLHFGFHPAASKRLQEVISNASYRRTPGADRDGAAPCRTCPACQVIERSELRIGRRILLKISIDNAKATGRVDDMPGWHWQFGHPGKSRACR
jgi:hypothetical protein